MTTKFARVRHTPRAAFPSMALTSLAVSLAALPVAAVIAWAARGLDGAASAATAVLICTAVLMAGMLATRWVLAQPDALALAGALVVLLMQVALLAAIGLVLAEQPWVDTDVFTLTALVVTLAWQTGVVLGYARGRHAIGAGGQGA